MKLFVLLSILFSLPSFAGFDPETEDYIPTFECTKESLNKDIDQYLLDTWIDDFKEGFFEKEKQKEDRPIIQIIKDYADRTWSVKEELDQINYKAHLAYIKQCDNFTDLVSDQKAGDPELDSEIGYFYSTSKNLDYMLRIIAEERDIETLKKLLDAGLNIDILFEVPLKLFHDDFYNLHGYVNFYENPEKHNTNEAIAFTKFLIEQGSKGTIEQ